MALFSRNKADESKGQEAVVEKAPTKVASTTDRNLSAVIKKPRITEKAVRKTEHSVYTFEVDKAATKYDVRDAVKALYNVTPVKVNIVNKLPRKKLSRSRGRVVSQKGLKKAYVYLKPGETINFI
ncbi:MAG: 50S ribosomal protein L23 [Patescibacteria group bacterium]